MKKPVTSFKEERQLHQATRGDTAKAKVVAEDRSHSSTHEGRGIPNPMAPSVTLKTVDSDIKDVIQQLFEIQSAVHGYLGPETQQELVRKIKNLTQALSTLSSHTRPSQQESQSPDPSQSPTDKDPPIQTIQLPPEIIDYVDAARNPDIYTREFVELVQRGNQDLKGKAEAFAGFRDVLAREMENAMPECRGEVGRVLEGTGGGNGNGNGKEKGKEGGEDAATGTG